MIRAQAIPALAIAGLLAAACSSTPPSTTYYTPGAAPVAVAGSTATYSAGTGTVAGGVNTFSTTDRVIVGEPASRTTVVDNGAAPSGTVVGGSTLNPNPNAGAALGANTGAINSAPRAPSSNKPGTSD